MTGRVLVLDFDGTLAQLEIPWDELRDASGVERIVELWSRGDDAWAPVTDAELRAAAVAEPVLPTIRLAEGSAQVAILTNNSERAVQVFLGRFPALAERVVVVVGREGLAGPKTDFDVFSRGLTRCLEELGDAAVTYVGDMEYELDFARRLGVEAIDVQEVGA